MPYTKNPTSYLGVKSRNPPNMFIKYRRPTINDIEPFNMGDFWVIPTQLPPLPTEEVWELVGMQQNQASWVQLNSADSAVYLNHQLLVGAGTSTIGQLPLGSSGQLLLSGGASADPTWNSSGDAGQILLSGGASTSPSWNTSGTLNQVLHSGGAGMPPVWKGTGPIGAITTINVQYLTTPGAGTYTPTTGMIQCMVECVGGGAGGYGSAQQDLVNPISNTGAGMPGAAYCRKMFTAAEIGASQTYSIGAAGVGGIAPTPNGTTPGTSGGDTTFGGVMTAGGGLVTGGAALEGTAGDASGGDVNISGNKGIAGWYNGTVLTSSGIGGNSGFAYGTGGKGFNNSTSTYSNDGMTGTGYGAGAGGGNANTYPSAGTASFNGGNGTSGIIIITEYIQ